MPTAALNWMAYLADRSDLNLPPGPGLTGPFLTASQDDEVGDHIDDMASLMDTSAIDGTSSVGAMDGLMSWLTPVGYPLTFGLHQVHPAADADGFLVAPSIRDAAGSAAQGSLTNLAVGWWDEIGESSSAYEWVGGHVMTLVGAEPAPELGDRRYRLVVHDPATDLGPGFANLTQQSPFWPDEHVTASFPGTFKIDGQFYLGAFERLMGFSSLGLFTSATFITPKFGLVADPASDGLSLTFPADSKEVFLGTADDFGTVEDVALAPYGNEHIVVRDGGDIELVNGIDGSRTPLATVPGASRAVHDDDGRLVLLTADGIIRVLPDDSRDPRTRTPVPTDVDELAYDPTSDRLVGWDRETGTLSSYADDLTLVDRQVLPPLVDPGDPATPVSLTIDPSDGTLGLLAAGTNRVVSVTPGGQIAEIALGTGEPLAALVADSSGVWYAPTSDDGEILTFDRDGDAVAGAPFAGMHAATPFRVWQPMDIGEPLRGPNVLPQDAPRQPPHLTVADTTALVAAGETHEVEALLTDDTADPAGRALRWTVTGANPATGTVTTGPAGTVAVTWPATSPGSDHLLVWEDLQGNGTADAGEPAASTGVSTIAEHLTTTIQLAAGPEPSTIGEDVTITARVVAIGGLTPTGDVTFFDGPNQIGTAAVDHAGTATLTTAALTAGSHDLEAHYLGDALFAPSQAVTTHVVERIATRLTADPVVIRITPFAVTLRLAATLTDVAGNPLPGEPVRFVIAGSTSCTGTTGADGRVTCHRPGLALLGALLLGYDAVYDGDEAHDPSSAHGPLIR